MALHGSPKQGSANKMANIMKENMINSGIAFLAERAKDPNFNPFWNAPTVILVYG
jgi:hypothetical protein